VINLAQKVKAFPLFNLLLLFVPTYLSEKLKESLRRLNFHFANQVGLNQQNKTLCQCVVLKLFELLNVKFCIWLQKNSELDLSNSQGTLRKPSKVQGFKTCTGKLSLV
jgi:hypothetical protein